MFEIALVVFGIATMTLAVLIAKSPQCESCTKTLMNRVLDQNESRDLYQISGRAAWHREQLEALAEEAVERCGYTNDSQTPCAEIAREIVYCSRDPGDAMQRIFEIESLNQKGVEE